MPSAQTNDEWWYITQPKAKLDPPRTICQRRPSNIQVLQGRRVDSQSCHVRATLDGKGLRARSC